GSTHGVITETSPARKAIGRRSAILRVEAGELLVDAPLDVGPQRRTAVRARVARRPSAGLAGAAAAPSPGEDAQHDGARDDAGERQQPDEEIEAFLGRRGEDGGAELGDELRLDLTPRVPGGDASADESPHPVGNRSAR